MPPPTLAQVAAASRRQQGQPPTLGDVSSGNHTFELPASPGGGGHGGSLLGNLAGDVVSSIEGIPTAVKSLVTDPVGTAKNIGHSYAETYGPLVHGDFGKFWSNVHEHPLGPLMDFVTVASIIASAGAAAAALPEEAGARGLAAVALGRTAGPLRSIEHTLPSGEKVAGRALPRNAFRAKRAEALNHAMNKLDPNLPVIGEFSRAARALRNNAQTVKLAGEAEPILKNYLQAWSKLSKNERVATSILARVPVPSDLASWRRLIQQSGDPAGQETLRLLDDPKVRGLYHSPNKAMMAAHNAAGDLEALNVKMLSEAGLFDGVSAEARRFLPTQMARGARFVPDPEELKKLGVTLEDYDNAVGSFVPGSGALRVGGYVHAADQNNYGRVLSLDGGTALVHFINKEAGVEAKVNLPVGLLKPAHPDAAFNRIKRVLAPPKGQEKLPEVPDLAKEIAASNRPLPIYMRDVAVEPKRTFIGNAGAGRTPQLSPVSHSQGILFKTGLLALHPDVLSSSFLRSVKYDYYSAIHDSLLESAVKVPKGHGLPPGHVWIRTKRGDRIPHTETVKGQFKQDMADLFPEGRDALTTRLDAPDVLSEGDVRYAVPERFAHQVSREFTRAERTTRLMLERPMQVWRALVLNVRVGWLVNNIIGNHLMYALRNAGPAGIHAYLSMLGSTRGGAFLRKFLDMPEVRNSLTDEDVRALLPELSAGTFISTQLPTTGVAGKVSRILQPAGKGVAPIDRAVDAGLRRAAANATLRRSPEVRARLRSMPKETRSFREASRKELEANPKLAKLVVQDVHDALGNFLDLSPFERGFVRNAVPFYAWYKAISKVMARLPVDAPGRTALLVRFGQMGEEQSNAALGPLPSYLRGAVPLGGDTILKSQGLNAPETVVQLGRSLGALLPGGNAGQAQGLLGEFNPLGVAFFKALSNVQSNKPTSHGVGADALWSIAQGLPFYRLAQPQPSQIYQDPGYKAEIMSYLGVPIRKIDRGVAADRASAGN